MGQSPSSGANSAPASQEINPILGNPNVYYQFHKSSLVVTIVIQSPTQPICLRITLSIILPSMPRPSMCSLSVRFAYQNSIYSSVFRIHST